MKRKNIILIVFLFICLGVADLVTTIYGFNIGLIESDGIYVPFGFIIVSIICVLSVISLVEKGIVNKITPKFVILWFVGLNCLPIINNLYLIGSVV